MPLKNPLDVLFSDLIKETNQERRVPRPPKAPHKSTYANPDNWTLGKVVQLIHVTEGSLGVYQEYFHRSSPTARRLLPANPAAATDRTELVFGQHWLHPSYQAPAEPDSDIEVRALVARFAELMEEDLE